MGNAIGSATMQSAVARGSVLPRVPSAALVRMRSGARWFFWIAGLSMVNTIFAFLGGHLHFLTGLGATQLVDEIASKAGASAAGPALIIDSMIAGAFILIGISASRCNQFAFGMGMLLYAADGALLVLTHSWLSLAFHVLALSFMYRGFLAAQELRGIAALGQHSS